MAETIADTRGADDNPVPFLRQPVHLIAAWLLVALNILFTPQLVQIKPMMQLAMLTMLTGATVALAPRGTIARLRIGLSAVVFLMVWMVSVVWSSSVALWWGEFRFFATAIGTMTIALSVLPAREAKRALLFAMYVTIVGTWLVSLTDSSSHSGVGGAGWRGSFVHKNPMGAFMAIAMVTIHAFEPRRGRKWLATIAALALVMLSRSATAAALVVVALPALWSMKQFGSIEPRRAAARFASVAGGAFVLGMIGMIQAPVVLGAYGKDPTLSSRTEIWQATIPFIQDRPFFGWGLGVWVQRGISPAADINQQLGFQTVHAHNATIETLLTLGVVGLSALVLLWGSALRAGWRAAHGGDEVGSWTVAVCLILAVWGFSETLGEFHIGLLTIGLMLSIRSLAERQPSAASA